MSAVLLNARPILMAASILSIIGLALAIKIYNARSYIPRGYEPYYDAWRCKRCGALVQDEWDLEPHRLSHVSSPRSSPEPAANTEPSNNPVLRMSHS